MILLLLLILLMGLLASPAAAEEFTSNGVKIHYVVMGQGKPVLLIHGAYASAQRNWIAPGTAAELAKSYRVIALDCRGHGQSDKPESDYGLAMVEDVVRLMDHLDIQKCRVVGYSMGGMIALKLAVLHPDRVEKLVLGGMGMIEQSTRAQKFWEEIRPRESPVPIACLQQFGAFAITSAEARGLKMPVSVIVGEKDPVNRFFATKLKRARPGTPVTIIPQAGHLTCAGSPKFRAALVRDLKG